MTVNLPHFVAVGEALTDLVRTTGNRWISKVGGSSWNVARAVAAQGVDSAFAGAISCCWFGDALWRASKAAALDLRFLQRVDRSPLLAVVVQSRPPQYFFVGDDSADLYFDARALPSGWEEAVAWVHFGGISLAREPLAQRLVALATELHTLGVAISYDPNVRNVMDEQYQATFERMCRLASVIKVSDDDLIGLMRAVDPLQALQQVRARNPQAWWLYTEGAQGAQLLTPAGHWQARPPSIAAVDTIGAGDASIAALVAGRIQAPESAPETHLAGAVAAGTAACLTAGASPPTQEVVRVILDGVSVTRAS
ncbi:MAG: carbohydrate kinase [Gammaproteobacteria bacterium]|nr:carbohydrate kinase [Gammaproteobacteria bacterium]